MAGILHARRRQPVELDGEQQDQHQPDPEQWHGIGDDGGHRDQMIFPAAHPYGRQQSQQDADTEGKDERGAHQQQRGGQARQDQRQYRALVAEGIAEIQCQDVLDVECELNGHRLVEAEPLAQRLDVLGRRAAGFTREHRCRVAGCELQQQEIEHHHAQHDGDRL
jgi:hypothetical protein